VNSRRRIRELLIAGLTDSFGMALGWTVVNLVAVARGGLQEAGLYNAAMLAGVVLAAPATGWLTGRLHGRTLLTLAAAGEAVLRAGVLVALLAGLPSPVVAAGVAVMSVAAWTGFAGMRAEVAAADPRPAVMTRYVMGLAAVEAAGAALAALLHLRPGGMLATSLAVAIAAVYALSLVPTLLCARGAVVRRPEGGGGARPGLLAGVPLSLLGGAAGVMLLASGPTLLSVALATELYGHTAVVGAAVAFSVGSLLSSTAVGLIGRTGLPASLAWPLWGAGMLIGWVAAPSHLWGLFGAQLLSGLSMTAFEGVTDARVAERAEEGRVTAALAWSAAARALGSAVAVRTLPLLVAAPSVGGSSGILILALLTSAVLAGIAPTIQRGLATRPTGRAAAVTKAGPG
jgi:hypothetical protein